MTIDSNTIKTPNGLREYYTYIRTDNRSINGALQRNQINKKKTAELRYSNLLPSEVAALMAWADDLNAHAYSNNQSRYGTWAFTGLVTITNDGAYQRGQSYMTDELVLLIEET